MPPSSRTFHSGLSGSWTIMLWPRPKLRRYSWAMTIRWSPSASVQPARASSVGASGAGSVRAQSTIQVPPRQPAS